MAQMTAEEAAEWVKPLSFEKVRAMFAETDRRMAESRAKMSGGDAKLRALL